MRWKTAEELGIEPDILEALVWVRQQLADGAIKYFATDLRDSTAEFPIVEGRYFNMQVILLNFVNDHGCGSVGCIKGWMQEYLKRTIEQSHPLHDLFYPPSKTIGPLKWFDITPEMAVRTIDHYRATGDIVWYLES